MNEFEPGIFNSGMVLNYLLRKRSSFTLYLEDGTKLTGTLLGWDADFLLIKEGKYLQMVRINMISRLQAELDQIIAKDSAVLQENLTQSISETPKENAYTSSPLAKFKPTLTEVKAPPTVNENNNSDQKGDFKDKLEQLVRNW